MTTAETKTLKCDLCEFTTKAPTALGMHKRTKHGILGKSKASLNYRAAQEAKKNGTAPPPSKKLGRPIGSKTNSDKRSTELATVQATATPIHHHTNGHKAHRNHPATETAITFALGRFEALCGEISSKFNLPPLDFAHALVTAIAGQYSQVR